MTRYYVISESNTDYENYTEFIRRLNPAFNLPSKGNRTTRYNDRWVKAATPESLIIIEETDWTTAQTVMTSAEIAATVTSAPTGFVVNTYQDNQTSHNIEFPYSTDIAVICDGDSIMHSANAPYDLDLADRVYTQIDNDLVEPDTIVRNAAVGGRTMSAIAGDSDTKIENINFPENCTKILVIWAGTNDINTGTTPASTYTHLTNYISNVTSAISDLNVVVATPIARLNASITTLLSNYRDSIVNASNVALHGYTVADTGNHEHFSVSSATVVNNTTYYQADKEHPTTTATPLLASVITSAINTLL